MARDLKTTVEKYIKNIKTAGMTHIKVELEAQLSRREVILNGDDCETCTGSGVVRLHDGGGNEYCNTCASCSGRGNTRTVLRFNREDFCQEWLKEKVKDINFEYFYFYRDGSVDSELTFTVKIEDANRVIDVINAWKELAEANGRGMITDGAGMHITVMPQATYPASGTLSSAGISNFKSEVTKLLPSILLLGTASEKTRLLRQYRFPQVSDSKYSSIYIKSRGSIEYRLFDTCYDNPEVFFEYLGTIARTLEFYKDPSKKVSLKAPQSYTYHETEYKTSSMVNSVEKIDYIKNTIKYVKPEGYTIKEVTEKRGIKLTVGNMRKQNEERLKELRKAYKTYYDSLMSKVTGEANTYEKNSIQYWRDNDIMSDLSDSDLLKLLRTVPSIESESKFISRNQTKAQGTALTTVTA